MDHDSLEAFRRRLLGHRLSLVKQGRRASAAELELLAEHEPDWVDAAANETAATALERLGEAQRREVDRIDLALARMKRGFYGECAVCRAPIDRQRLRAVPDTDRCSACAPNA
jgi:DnaK suppressor protein